MWNVPVSRRAALSAGVGAFGLSLPKLLAADERLKKPVAKAKSVILLFQWGGPSHVDTFDLKLSAPEGTRTHFAPIKTSQLGLPICDKLPETAKIMHKVSLVHSLWHTMKNHNSAGYYALTGHAPPLDDQRLRDSKELFPAFGSTVSRFAPSAGTLPSFVSLPTEIRDGAITPGQHASFLGKKYDPLRILSDPNASGFRLPQLSLPENLSPKRLGNRRELMKLIDRQSGLMEKSAVARGFDSYYDRSLAMLTSRKVKQAFDLSREPEKVRDRYGRTSYGQSCLLARRLVESGVRFVNVYFDRSIGGRKIDSGGWDTHGFDNTRMYYVMPRRHLPMTDHTLPVLINDLEERGLLDETLVIWMGEFGRTPKINKSVSRDHWPQCYTALLAGGSVKKGLRYGASDKTGAFPASKPMKPDDLAATVYELCGIPPQTEIRDTLDRPHPIAAGKVARGLIA